MKTCGKQMKWMRLDGTIRKGACGMNDMVCKECWRKKTNNSR